uniref:Uncharacterized protein n=1 Tax=Globisporangium ultimum (strain ATCC 200006 / CBS 805.95 / DAOM BR144) TaxID=431595 RepID=K3WEH7_GLOUD
MLQFTETELISGTKAYVNRFLQKWFEMCCKSEFKLTQGQTFHPFRRGAAQNANRDSKLSTPWSMDRGG